MSDSLWADIQSAIDFGYATAAGILGPMYSVYRANGPLNPLDPANLVTTTPAAFASSPNRFTKPNMYASPIWYPQVDPTVVQGGDYLVGPAGTFFMHPQQPLLPPSCVGCNAVLSFSRPGPSATEGSGADEYGDSTPPTALLTSWPASMLAGTKGEKSDDGLPRDVRQPWYAVLLPSTGGVEIMVDDDVVDANGHSYEVSSVELTDLGWRLTVMFTGA